MKSDDICGGLKTDCCGYCWKWKGGCVIHDCTVLFEHTENCFKLIGYSTIYGFIVQLVVQQINNNKQ